MAGELFRVFLWLFVVAMSNVVLGRSDFKCSADEFECVQSQTCTRLSWKCDGEDDCFDGEDEVGCPPVTCKPGYFKCDNGRCIEQSWVCDRASDCSGGEDEAPIQKCNQTSCNGPHDFQCRNGECIQESFRCDRENDCEDQSDEDGCPELNCTSTEFKCANNATCISHDMKCNGVHDCFDKSDEKDCPPTCNATTEFTCSSGECHPISFRCDGDKDCLDASDEHTCPPPPTVAPCSKDVFSCGDGDCLPMTWKCDGTADCNDGSDEFGCPPACATMQFRCVRSGKCISHHLKCDGVKNCLDGSDEAECVLTSSCDDVSSFRCGTSSHCINQTNVCNGIRNCPGGDDEALNCGIDECSDHNGHCAYKCRDLPIGFECYCDRGYKLVNDSRSCEDLNECEEVYGSCSQTCVNFKGSFKCGCVEGYHLDTAATATCRATGPQAYLVFGGEHSIHNLTRSGTEYGMVVSNLKTPIAVGYDLQSGYVYWTDILDEKIERGRLLGDGKVETVVDKVERSNGLAIDWIGKKIYWTDEKLKSIEVSELDGKNRLKLFTFTHDLPRGIALDPFKRYLFWTDWSGVHPKIERSSMDGDSDSRQIILNTDLTWPTALTIDTILQRLFFADTKSRQIETIKYDGSARKTLVSKGLFHPIGLAVFEDHLYYTDYTLNKIYTINKRSGQRLGEVRNNLKRPTGIDVVHPLLQKQDQQEMTLTAPPGRAFPVPTQCNQNNGGCSHLCLLSSTSSKNYTCRCPDGLPLRSDGKSCIDPNATASQPPVKTTTVPTTRTTGPPTRKPSTQATLTTMKNEGNPLAKKREGSSNSGPMIAGVTVAVVVVIFLVLAAFLFWRKRAKMADRSILFYKDSSRTPLQNDFDDDAIKSQDEFGGMSRVQFT